MDGDRILALLNVMVIVIRMSRDEWCGITQEIPPDGVEFFRPDQFFVVKIDGAHYESMEDAPGRTSFGRADNPAPIWGGLQEVGFYSAISDISRGIQRPRNATPDAEPARRRITRKRESTRMKAARAKTKDNNPLKRAARKKCSSIPGRHSVCEMGNPCDRFGALRWDGEVRRGTICRTAGMAQLRDIQDPPGPLLSLLNGAVDYASDFHHIERDCDALLSFASIGSNIDAPTVTRGS